MTTIMEIYQAEREKLKKELEELRDLKEAVDCLCASLERMRLKYGQQERNHAHADRLFDVARQSVKTMLAVSGVGVNVLSDEPHTPFPADKIVAAMPMAGIVVGAVLTVWMLVKDLYVPAVLAGILSALSWLEAQVVYRRRIAVSAVAKLNNHELLRVLDRTMEALEDAIDQELQQRRQEKLAAAADSNEEQPAVISKELLDAIQMLMEAGQGKDGEYALKALPKLNDALLNQGIKQVMYSEETAQYFEMYPAVEGGITIRPALMKDGRVLMPGQATEEM